MKRIFLALALACATLFAYGQDFPAGMRNELSEIGEDDNEYTIFTYKDEDGTFGYYLSVSHSFDILSIFTDDSNSSFSHIDETCLWLGANAGEAKATLESMATLLEATPGTVAQFPCRLSTGAERLGENGTATVVVVKRFLQGKRLNFQFVSGGHTAEADLTRGALKSIRWNFDLAMKLHPEK
jgi:hypothetical protein